MPQPQVRVRLFADLREAADEPETVVEGETVGEALDALVERHPSLGERLFEDGELRSHLNLVADGESAELDTPTADVEEVAVYPPVSGG